MINDVQCLHTFISWYRIYSTASLITYNILRNAVMNVSHSSKSIEYKYWICIEIDDREEQQWTNEHTFRYIFETSFYRFRNRFVSISCGNVSRQNYIYYENSRPSFVTIPEGMTFVTFPLYYCIVSPRDTLTSLAPFQQS